MKRPVRKHLFLPAAAACAALCICFISATATAQPEPVIELPEPPTAQEMTAAIVEEPPSKLLNVALEQTPPEPAQTQDAVQTPPEPVKTQDAVQPETVDPAPENAQTPPQEPTQAEKPAAPNVSAAPQETGVPEDLVLLDTFIATAYCVTGTTSTGTYTTVDRTLAVNPNIIPYGTHVWIFLDDGTLVGDYYAEDTGSNMMEHPYVVDIYMGEDSYDECILWGARHVSIYTEG